MYLGSECNSMKTRELGMKLHHNPSVISRLYGLHAERRDINVEERIARVLNR